MDISRRYGNVISLFQTSWYLPRDVVDKGVAIFQRLGTPEYHSKRQEFYQNRDNVPEMALPGTPYNWRSDDPKTRLLGRLGVHRTPDGTAVVPVHGILAKRMNEIDISEQGTSTDMLSDAFEILANANDIRGVALDVSSPGGSVLGVEGAAQSLMSLRDNKPVYALSNEIMASGAYYIAAHANQIYVTPTSYTGSVGVYTTRIDATKFWENQGVGVHVISRGDFKTDRNPDTPFSEEERARIQEEVDTYYNLFVDAVARGRSIDRDTALKLADGSCEVGQKAVERGFADAVSNLSWMVSAMDEQTAPLFAMQSQTKTVDTAMNIFGKGKKEDTVELQGEDDPIVSEEVDKEADEVEASADIAMREAAIAEEEKRLADRERALIEREVKADFDDLVESGQLLPRQRAYLENLALQLRLDPFKVAVPIDGVEEDDIYGAYESLMSALMVGAPQVEYAEIVKDGDEPPTTDVSDPVIGAKVLTTVMEKEGLSSDEAYAFVKENGVPEYVANALKESINGKSE